ncbi:hypothetical protein E1B28_001779 [Marasmius oreades]|uniref:Uncharacterized protein n=1 Tax=Marasmius oreades TaxID=181124 RepID=A0A9P8AFI8_9AGAR|nr:uncharacterized protein E1B28_001779 [Marasmius oreades]KAG7099986.1 hypothetical protein E1B28_001779 [Marasmius oreades]
MIFLVRDALRIPLYNTNITKMVLVLLFICFFHDLVSAAPTRREDEQSNGLKPQVWVPILIIALLMVVIVTVTWSKKRGFLHWGSIGQAAAAGVGAFSAPGGVVQTRELTADQLTGNTTNTSSSNNGNGNRTRRTRRPRRTPSQISTTSLPAYNKEPGEQELVIFRGPADMEDVPIHSVTAAVEMPTVEEDGDSELSNSRYNLVPESPQDMPLLHEVDRSTTVLAPSAANSRGRPSIETMNSNSDESSLMRIDTTPTIDDSPDPRGAAPAYFEVVDIGEVPMGNASQITNRTLTIATTPDTTQQTQPNDNTNPPSPSRRGTFRFAHIFGRHSSHRASQSHSSATSPPVLPPGIPVPRNAAAHGQHGRTESAGGLSLTSTVSRSTQASPANRSRSRMSVYHRPSQSSSSLLSFVNPLTRKKSSTTLHSINDLTSPSLISLQSISAPLSHTLVKTEFTYPRSGPTPEQLKLISSRENMAGRFGVPYGAEAVRWARSRTELVDSEPPPGFEEISGSPGPNGSSTNASASGTSSTPGSNGSASTTLTSASSVDANVGGASGNPDPATIGTATTSPPVIRVDPASKPPTPRGPSPSPSAVADTATAAPSFSSPSSSPDPNPNPALIPIPESPPTPNSTISTNTQSRFVPLSETQSVSSKANKEKASPPSAFNAEFNVDDDLFYTRALSRASSSRSFATANESLSEFGERTGARTGKGTLNSRSDTMRSETPALSIAESRYYSGDDDDDDDEGGDQRSFRGTRRYDESDSGEETETEYEDSERRNRRLTVRA